MVGDHMNLLVTALGGAPEPKNTDEERAAAAAFDAFNATGDGYLIEQSTRLHTIGYALLDSPAARSDLYVPRRGTRLPVPVPGRRRGGCQRIPRR